MFVLNLSTCPAPPPPLGNTSLGTRSPAHSKHNAMEAFN